jgi:hypothetical protein
LNRAAIEHRLVEIREFQPNASGCEGKIAGQLHRAIGSRILIR